MSDDICPRCHQSTAPGWIDGRIPKLEARVRELEAELKMAREEHYFQSCLTRDLLPYQERAERAEAERDALRAENKRLRGALDRAARTLRGETGCEDQGQAYDTAQRIIDAALAQGEKL